MKLKKEKYQMKIWSMGIIKFNKGGNYMKNYRISISGNYEEIELLIECKNIDKISNSKIKINEEIILDTSYFPIDVRLVEENK